METSIKPSNATKMQCSYYEGYQQEKPDRLRFFFIKKLLTCVLVALFLYSTNQAAQAQGSPPPLPTNFATGEVTDNSVTLSWAHVTDGSVDGYLILIGNQITIPSNGTPLPSSPTIVVGGINTYVLGGLTPATLYTFHIVSYKLNDSSLATYSTQSKSVTRFTLATPPPIGLSSSSINFSAVATNSLSISLSSPPAEGQYLVLRFSNMQDLNDYSPQNGAEPSLGSGVMVSSGGTNTNFNDTGLQKKTEYFYKIYIYNGGGATTHYASNFASGSITTDVGDITQPVISSIQVFKNPFLLGDNTQSITLVFSEPINTAVFPFLRFSMGKWPSSSSSWSFDSTTFSQTSNYALPNAGEQGIVNVNMTSTNLTDAAGNALSLQDNTSISFNIDTQAPTATVTPSPATISINSPTLTVTVTYNEIMDETQPPTLTFNKSGENFTLDNNSSQWSTTNNLSTYTATYDHNFTSEQTDGITITVEGAQDLLGNTQQVAVISDPFSIDLQSPTAVATLSPQVVTINSSTLTVKIIYSEIMDETQTPTLTFNKSGENFTLNNNLSQWSTTNNLSTYTATYNYNTDNSEQTDDITVTAGNARDAAGNFQQVAISNSFTIDTEKPTATVTLSTPTININNPALTVTITYSEIMNQISSNPTINFNKSESNFTFRSGSAQWSTPTVYTATYDYNTSYVEMVDNVKITVEGATDSFDNPQEIAESDPFSIDTQIPTASISYDDDDGIVSDGQTIFITAKLSDPIQSAPSFKISVKMENGLELLSPTDLSQIIGLYYGYSLRINTNGANGKAEVTLLDAQSSGGNTIASQPISGKFFTIDNTAPNFTTLSPVNNALNTPTNATLRIAFNESVRWVSGKDILLYAQNNGSSTVVETFSSADANDETRELSFNLMGSKLTQGTKYYVEIPEDALVDLAGNAFGGFTTASEWSFTTFAPPVVDSIKLSAGAACIGESITITGQFLTGVTEVRFGSDPANGIVLERDLDIQDDNNLRVAVPRGAQNGDIYLTKAARNGNPEASTNAGEDIEIGPNTAVLAAGSTTIPNVCSEGSVLTTPIQVNISGGKGEYTVTYRLQTNTDQEENTVNSYTNLDDINVRPHKDNADHTIRLVAVKDSNGCSVPANFLAGQFIVHRNELPKVQAGGSSATPNEVSICLMPKQSDITLDMATLGTAPSKTGSSGVLWASRGEGVIVNSTNLIPIYQFTNGDILNGGVSFSVKTTGVPLGCESVSDNITIKFASRPIANSGGEFGLLHHCWDESNTNVQVQLNGTISGARSYEWSTTGNGLFSDSAIANPLYTFTEEERNQGFAKVALTATDGTCNTSGGDNNRSLADTLTIQLIRPPINFLKSPKIKVCMGESVIYTLSVLRSTSTFSWSISGSGGDFSEEQPDIGNGAITAAKWGNKPGEYTLSVVETDEYGCITPPIETTVTVYNSINPGIEGSVFTFPNGVEVLFPLQPKGGKKSGKNMEFSGDGVISVSNKDNLRDYYFDPAGLWDLLKENQGELETKSTISYRYKIEEPNCYSEVKTQDFYVYNANQAFMLTLADDPNETRLELNSNGKYEVCRDQLVKIKVDPAFNRAKPLFSGHLFKGFTLDEPDSVKNLGAPNGPFINTPSTPLNNNSTDQDTVNHVLKWEARLYTDRLERTSVISPLVTEVEINGWQYTGAGDDRMPPPNYGRITITINEIPGLSYNAVPEKLCSEGEPIQLTKNEINNPGKNYTFFSTIDVDEEDKDASQENNFITNDPLANSFTLNPSAGKLFPNTSNYPPPKEVEINYAYQDTKGCNDTTSFTVTVVKTPPKPVVLDFGTKDATALCAIDGEIPTAVVDNVASYTYMPEDEEEENTVRATVRWYSEASLENSTFLEETEEYTPSKEEGDEDIDVTKNGVTNYYVTQGIEGCISNLLKVDYEVLNTPTFSWNKSCMSGETVLRVDLGNIEANSLNWEVKEETTTEYISGDKGKEVPRINSFKHQFSKIGRDTVIMYITSKNNCNTSLTQSLIMLQNIPVEKSKPYLESFNQGNGGFVALAATTSLQGTSSWEHGELGDEKPSRPPRDQVSEVWATRLNATYGKGERSYLYVGCVDLTEAKSPLITFDSWVNVPEGTDGIVLQYSTDGKVISDPTKVWKAVGNVGGGVNWYNKILIESSPNTAANNFGWSSEDNDWRASKQSLQKAKDDQMKSEGSSGEKKIPIFRFVFAASQGDIAKTLGGFALDNFRISEKTRIVLLENFTNKSRSANRQDEAAQSKTIREFLPNSIGIQLVKINYHVGFPSMDPLNLDNPNAPGARALYYGITTTPTAVLDGLIAPDNDNDGKADLFSQWGPNENAKRSLDPAEAEMIIKINSPGSVPQDGVSIEVSVTPRENIEGAKLYIAVLEKKIAKGDLPEGKQNMLAPGNDTDTLEYIFKEMLPSPYGLHVGTLQQLKEYKFGPYEWYPKPPKIYSNDIAIAAFLQNDETKSMYQVTFIDKINMPDVITKINESNPSDHIKIYPNPADENIRISLPYPVQSDTHVRLIGPMGRILKQVAVPRGKSTQEMTVQSLAEGVYTLKIERGDAPPAYEKIVIDHGRQ